MTKSKYEVTFIAETDQDGLVSMTLKNIKEIVDTNEDDEDDEDND